MRIAASTLAGLGGLLLSASLGNGPVPANPAPSGSVFDAATFSVSYSRGELRLRGVTASDEHEAALLQLAEDHFDDADAHTEFKPAVLLPGYWDAATNRLLYALAAAESATAIMDRDSVRIRAVSTRPDALAARIEFLNDSLGDEISLVTDIVDVTAEAPFATLCRRVFDDLVIDPVWFRESSAELRTSSHATLDRLIEFAHDCPAAALEITGHTDASGDETWNRPLSAARAQAVADYMTARGIGAERLRVAGRGSAEPVADNNSELGRERNRRIEFGLRY